MSNADRHPVPAGRFISVADQIGGIPRKLVGPFGLQTSFNYRPTSCWGEHIDLCHVNVSIQTRVMLMWVHRPDRVVVGTQTKDIWKWVYRLRSCWSEYTDPCRVEVSTETQVMLQWVLRHLSCQLKHTDPCHAEVSTQTRVMLDAVSTQTLSLIHISEPTRRA